MLQWCVWCIRNGHDSHARRDRSQPCFERSGTPGPRPCNCHPRRARGGSCGARHSRHPPSTPRTRRAANGAECTHSRVSVALCPLTTKFPANPRCLLRNYESRALAPTCRASKLTTRYCFLLSPAGRRFRYEIDPKLPSIRQAAMNRDFGAAASSGVSSLCRFLRWNSCLQSTCLASTYRPRTPRSRWPPRTRRRHFSSSHKYREVR